MAKLHTHLAGFQLTKRNHWLIPVSQLVWNINTKPVLYGPLVVFTQIGARIRQFSTRI